MSTVTIPDVVPSPAEDAEQLHKAFSGWGTNEDLIISILTHRNAVQRRAIRQAYTNTYGEDLLKSLDKELTSNFEKAILLWTMVPVERDALLANEACVKWKPTNRVLIEIACTRNSAELLWVKQAYHARYHKSLEEDVAVQAQGDFRKLMVPLISVYRYEGPEVDMTLAKSEAKILNEKIKGNTYSDDEVIRILTTRSKAQLTATFNQYKNEFRNEVNKDLKSDPKDDYLSALRVIIRCITCPDRYYEKILRLAINKMGTDEGALTRIVTTRAEVDMKDIKDQYYKRNSIQLEKAIVKDTSGDYEAFILALIGAENA